MDFSQLIKQHLTTFTVCKQSEGRIIGGEWVKGEETQEIMQGAIISFKQSKILNSGGTITEQDRALYMLKPISEALQGAKVIYEGKEYSISSSNDNALFTGVYSYILKRCNVFDEGV